MAFLGGNSNGVVQLCTETVQNRSSGFDKELIGALVWQRLEKSDA